MLRLAAPQGAFYTGFEPARPRRIEFRYTPKHGSGLQVVERALTRPCRHRRRIGELKELRRETGPYAMDMKERQRGMDWQLTVADARWNLKSIYPQIAP